MKIIVCIKRVPDTESRIAIAADGVSIDTQGLKFVLNPYDEFALEEALRLKEAAGEGSVTVLTLGGEDSAPPRSWRRRFASASSTWSSSASRRSMTTTCRCR
jgi:electron transfer flavoprotein alpha/beta subunit